MRSTRDVILLISSFDLLRKTHRIVKHTNKKATALIAKWLLIAAIYADKKNLRRASKRSFYAPKG
jgi:hypothetical protein